MAPTSIPHPNAERPAVADADIRLVARFIALGRRLMPWNAQLGELPQAVRDELLLAARVALTDRTWHDAERWTRDELARERHGRTFNALSLDDQHAVAEDVVRVTTALRAYLSGATEPLSPWLRTQTELGACEEVG